MWTKIVVGASMKRIAALKKWETECDASRAEYADVRYLKLESSVPRVGSDCYLIQAARHLLRMLIQ